jgi:calcineurin-like phosphoesterase family protein
VVAISEWNEIVGKKDVIYIIGDFLWKDKQYARRVLEKLNGIKHFIRGNHDKAIIGNENYFESVSDIKNVEFKRDLYPFIEDDRFIVTMCHYPMASFYQKPRYSMQLHGHVHGNMDDYNARSSDLRVDVGYDSKSINCYTFKDLKSLYSYYYTKRELTKDLMINR